MSKIKSLQYLLLDTLNKRDKKKSKNFSNNLRVSQDQNYYLISWIDHNKKKNFRIEKNKFIFYQRNDLEGTKLDLSSSLEINNKNAELVIDEISKNKKNEDKSLNFFFKYLTHLIIILSSFYLVIQTSNLENKIIPVIIIILFIFDIIDKRQIILYLMIGCLTIFQPNKFIFFYSLFLVLFNFFEPIYYFKKSKILLLIVIIFYNFNFLNFSSINIDAHFFIINALIFLNIIFNFVRYNSNYNWIYCVPAFTYAFLFNGEFIHSYIWITVCFFLSFLFNYLDKVFFLKIKTSPMLE